MPFIYDALVIQSKTLARLTNKVLFLFPELYQCEWYIIRQLLFICGLFWVSKNGAAGRDQCVTDSLSQTPTPEGIL